MTTASICSPSSAWPCEPGPKVGRASHAGRPSGVARNPSRLMPTCVRISIVFSLTAIDRAGLLSGSGLAGQFRAEGVQKGAGAMLAEGGILVAIEEGALFGDDQTGLGAGGF